MVTPESLLSSQIQQIELPVGGQIKLNGITIVKKGEGLFEMQQPAFDGKSTQTHQVRGEINIGQGTINNGIINYSKKHKEIVIATLDREVKNKSQGQKLIIRGKKRLEVIGALRTY